MPQLAAESGRRHVLKVNPLAGDFPMTKLKSAFGWARTHAWSLALVSLPFILAACNKGGGTSGY